MLSLHPDLRKYLTTYFIMLGLIFRYLHNKLKNFLFVCLFMHAYLAVFSLSAIFVCQIMLLDFTLG